MHYLNSRMTHAMNYSLNIAPNSYMTIDLISPLPQSLTQTMTSYRTLEPTHCTKNTPTSSPTLDPKSTLNLDLASSIYFVWWRSACVTVGRTSLP